jgi:hypothetical protein
VPLAGTNFPGAGLDVGTLLPGGWEPAVTGPGRELDVDDDDAQAAATAGSRSDAMTRVVRRT